MVVDGFRAAERLAVFPMSGRQVAELKRNDLLEIIVGVFRIIYRIDAKHAAILTLRHTKQLPDAGELPDL